MPSFFVAHGTSLLSLCAGLGGVTFFCRCERMHRVHGLEAVFVLHVDGFVSCAPCLCWVSFVSCIAHVSIHFIHSEISNQRRYPRSPITPFVVPQLL